jgi:hypothetical protein
VGCALKRHRYSETYAFKGHTQPMPFKGGLVFDVGFSICIPRHATNHTGKPGRECVRWFFKTFQEQRQRP